MEPDIPDSDTDRARVCGSSRGLVGAGRAVDSEDSEEGRLSAMASWSVVGSNDEPRIAANASKGGGKKVESDPSPEGTMDRLSFLQEGEQFYNFAWTRLRLGSTFGETLFYKRDAERDK